MTNRTIADIIADQSPLVLAAGPSLLCMQARNIRDDVANTPGMNARALVVWLQSPHPTMPHFIIPAQDTDNIVSYITSLHTKQ